jgi:predicted transcriptional regulator
LLVSQILKDKGDLVFTASPHETVGAAALSKPISTCMTRDVVFAQPEETVDALLARMTDRRIRHLPVCKGKRLAGIISIGDLVKYKISEAQAEAEGLKAYIAAG